ncbi:hypothetical protein NIES39_L05770 [Arthrospira platensis NIES-39]|nr:hypothetical protein NIES39_L05770 [Arthrospira platensis NIES-39]
MGIVQSQFCYFSLANHWFKVIQPSLPLLTYNPVAFWVIPLRCPKTPWSKSGWLEKNL